MCGIVGLLAKTDEIRNELGSLVTPMFSCMAARGPDSGGLAIFREPVEHPLLRFNIFARDANYDWESLGAALAGARQNGQVAEARPVQVESIQNHAVITTAIAPDAFRAWLPEYDAALYVISVGREMDVFKDEGSPAEIARRYRFAELSGSHCVGHTRMATESAVTPAHSHPFTAGEDFCLVHNGSLSNPYMLRRRLEREGLVFDTDNDTEAACRYIEWRLRRGDDLDTALQHAFRELDGFYTLLMATPDQLTLVRDPFACKPAVVAVTDEYVAVGSEFRALAHLPGIEAAEIFEPAPEEIYTWQV